MMGAFDDLIPQAKAGAFDDLVPQQNGGLTGNRQAPQQELSIGERAATAINDLLGGAIEKVGPYARGFVQGAADPVVGTAQLGANLISGLLPQQKTLSSLITGQGQSFGDRVNRAIAEKERESERLGTSGVARFVGGVASPMNLIAAARLTKAPTVMQGASLGVASGLMQPVATEGNYAAKKAEQALIGGVAGGAGTAAIRGISGALSPQLTKAQELLAREGVEMTPGQLAGGAVSRFEEKLTSQPFVGGAITEGRQRGIEQFNKAVLNRVLEPIGQKTDKIGREGFKEVKQTIGEAYDELLPKLNFRPDQQFADDLARLREMADLLPKKAGMHGKEINQFETILEKQLFKRATPQGNMSGESLKAAEGEIGRLARGYKADPSFDNRQLGAALDELRNVIRQNLIRSNPDQASALRNINEAYANYARLRRASSSVGAEEGIFSPAQLLSAVKAEDKTIGKAGFGQGKALLQDLAEAGKTVLGNKVPNSGTADRLAAQLGSPLAIPAMAGGALAGIPASVIYSRPVSQLLNRAVMAQRGQGAQRLADLLRTAAAPAVLGGVGAIE